jgi:hypothetical protein
MRSLRRAAEIDRGIVAPAGGAAQTTGAVPSPCAQKMAVDEKIGSISEFDSFSIFGFVFVGMTTLCKHGS